MDVSGPLTIASSDQERSIDDRIREVLANYGRLPIDAATVSERDDLFRLGLTSHASVNVMLALEDAFDIEFPEALLRKSVFQSVGAMRDAISGLTEIGSGS